MAARTGLSQADAEKRVNDVVTQVKSDADAARKATAQLAFWLVASLLIGAFCASLAATEGGGLRDGTWGRKAQPANFNMKGKHPCPFFSGLSESRFPLIILILLLR